MKRLKTFVIAGTLLFAGLAFTSCDSADQATEAETTEQTAQEGSWVCPMGCEVNDNGELIKHDGPGKCSVCEMDLVDEDA